jgi:hypothetical protein
MSSRILRVIPLSEPWVVLYPGPKPWVESVVAMAIVEDDEHGTQRVWPLVGGEWVDTVDTDMGDHRVLSLRDFERERETWIALLEKEHRSAVEAMSKTDRA